MGTGGDATAGTSGAGTGGVGASAGMSGDAGTGGEAGGSGGAGSGNGGKGGKGDDCGALLEALAEALEQARVCMRSVGSCRGFVEDTCGCKVPVNDPDSAASEHYLALLDQLKERKECAIACPAVVCSEPDDASCLMPVQGDRGQCVASRDDD